MEEANSPLTSYPVIGGGGGMMGGIDLGLPVSTDLTDRVHLLPCSVKYDGPCPVSDYFKPQKTEMVVDGLTVEESYFRGRKLQGVTIPLPEGYCGYVLRKKKLESFQKGKNLEAPEGKVSHWKACAEFGSLTYWNHDNAPSPDDPLMRSFHWFSVANALHKPVAAEEMASASTLLHQDRKS